MEEFRIWTSDLSTTVISDTSPWVLPRPVMGTYCYFLTVSGFVTRRFKVLGFPEAFLEEEVNSSGGLLVMSENKR